MKKRSPPQRRRQTRPASPAPARSKRPSGAGQTLAARLHLHQAALISLSKNEAIQSGDLARAFQVITGITARTNNVGRTSIWLYTPDRSAIVLQDLYELDTGRHSDGTILHARDFPAYFAALECEDYALAADNAHTDPRTKEFSAPYLKPLGIGAMLDAPIRHKGKTIGVLCQEHFGGPRAWAPEDISFASSLASMVALAMDTAERVQVEQALRRSQLELERYVTERTAALQLSEHRIRAILDTAYDAFLAIDASGTITEWNRQAELTFGWPRDQALGRPLVETIIPPQYREAHKKGLARFLATGEGVVLNKRLELTALRRNGQEFPIEITIWPVRSGEAWTFNAFVGDITERKQAEREKAALQEQLHQAQKMEAIGQLAGGIAHDFNNLLTVINGYSEYLLSFSDMDQALRSDLEQIQQAGLRAAGLTQRLLAFSRRQVLETKVLDLNEIVARMDVLLRRLIGEDIHLVTVPDPSLGCVEADPTQIEQVIMNLAVNARDAMPDGGTLTIETQNVELDEVYAQTHQGTPTGSYVMLAVSDTGVGMDAATRARLFEPFFTTKEAGKGTGLGLATAYGIVKQSNGHIWVYSESGRGSTFKVYLPRVEASTGKPEAVGSGTLLHGGSETILLVEDEELVRNLAGKVLRAKGYTVIEAVKGSVALDLCRERSEPIHLVVTDVVMPEMNGREMADQLLALRPALKVLFMSGYTDRAIVQHGVLNPGTAFLQKPFSPERLLRKVRDMLDDRL